MRRDGSARKRAGEDGDEDETTNVQALWVHVVWRPTLRELRKARQVMGALKERFEKLQRYRAGNAPGWLNKDPEGKALHYDDVLALVEEVEREMAARHAELCASIVKLNSAWAEYVGGSKKG